MVEATIVQNCGLCRFSHVIPESEHLICRRHPPIPAYALTKDPSLPVWKSVWPGVEAGWYCAEFKSANYAETFPVE